MKVHTGMLGQPTDDVRSVVGGQIVQDHVQAAAPIVVALWAMTAAHPAR